eukprot:TRINITY_DN3847_c0_g1_i2.p1 TRINITY_DN3847_c0_g1~~TRINITY_DN3847_c0_g1_i2.p1  ORF type:complete len:537 (+),score=103.91 TRINITY_DN3847_c0_g1_i2:731-2341(+)
MTSTWRCVSPQWRGEARSASVILIRNGVPKLGQPVPYFLVTKLGQPVSLHSQPAPWQRRSSQVIALGTKFVGNGVVRRNQQGAAEVMPDRLNNVEQVTIPKQWLGGEMHALVVVKAIRISQGPQPYSVVITGRDLSSPQDFRTHKCHLCITNMTRPCDEFGYANGEGSVSQETCTVHGNWTRCELYQCKPGYVLESGNPPRCANWRFMQHPTARRAATAPPPRDSETRSERDARAPTRRPEAAPQHDLPLDLEPGLEQQYVVRIDRNEMAAIRSALQAANSNIKLTHRHRDPDSFREFVLPAEAVRVSVMPGILSVKFVPLHDRYGSLPSSNSSKHGQRPMFQLVLACSGVCGDHVVSSLERSSRTEPGFAIAEILPTSDRGELTVIMASRQTNRARAMLWLAQQRFTRWIEPYETPMLHSKWVRWFSQSGTEDQMPYWDAGLDGGAVTAGAENKAEAEVITMADTGLDYTNCLFDDTSVPIPTMVPRDPVSGTDWSLGVLPKAGGHLSLIHISEPTRLLSISYAVFCLKKKKKKQ